MKDAQTLNDILNAKSDAELNNILDGLFKALEDFAYKGLHSGKMDHAPADAVRFNGYASAAKDEIWPPSIVAAARMALFAGLQRSHREGFVLEFLNKVESLNKEIEDINSKIS